MNSFNENQFQTFDIFKYLLQILFCGITLYFTSSDINIFVSTGFSFKILDELLYLSLIMFALFYHAKVEVKFSNWFQAQKCITIKYGFIKLIKENLELYKIGRNSDLYYKIKISFMKIQKILFSFSLSKLNQSLIQYESKYLEWTNKFHFFLLSHNKCSWWC